MRPKRPALLLVSLALSAGQLASSAHADIYRGWHEDGVPAYSDRPQAGFTFFLGTDDLPQSSAARQQTSTAFHSGMRRFASEIRQVAAEHDLAPELLHAVIQVESGYNPRAVSPKGAIGLMQLMPATARRLGVADRQDPLANLRGGARYLRNLIGLFGGDLSLALAAYNAGEGAVRAHDLRIPPYPETIAYVAAVMRRYEALVGKF